MKIHTLTRSQILPVTLEEAWTFFSDPANLNKITPKDMGFDIVTENLPPMYAGQIIEYKVKIFPFVKVSWVTEIKNVNHKESFIDEQRFGPYKFWHHLHRFEEDEKGVVMTDLVHYALPFGFLGKIARFLFVKRKLDSIFDYRFKILEEYFNSSYGKKRNTK